MSDNKKYYWLKLKENFFDTDAMILLENIENGYLYSNILLKLYLRSLKNEGKLEYNEKIPYNSQMISKLVRHNVDVVESAITKFIQLGLIDKLDNGSMYMLDIQNFIGESSTESDRKREYRNRIKQEKLNISMLMDKCPDNRPPEIEKEIEKDKEIKKDKKSSSRDEQESKSLQDFEMIWEIYPRKEAKASAFKNYCTLLKGKKVLGKIVKLTNKEIWLATNNYSESVKGYDSKYIKLGSTFYNTSIFDYLEELND